MRFVSKKLIAEHNANSAPMCAFVDYIDAEKPILLRRMGSQIASDVHDAFHDQVSYDNGHTWSEPRISLDNIPVEGGYTVFVENATFLSPERNLFVHLTDQLFQADLDGPNMHTSTEVRFTVAPPQAFVEGNPAPVLISRFGLPQGMCISFTHIFQDSRGRLLVTVQNSCEDRDQRYSSLGFPVREDLPEYTVDVWEPRVLTGTWNADNTLDWELGNPVSFDIDKTSRGLCEGTLAELPDGRLAMVIRGSNAAWPNEKPGYKWLSFSEDGGLNWSAATPLGCSDGTLLQSSATGSCLLRSFTDGRLYWIGNLCAEGQQASANFPRAPLVIAEVQEEPFALKRETITVIGDREEGEDEFVQLSNFRCYQDRESAEVVVCLTRFGERGSENDDWLKADCYEYRVSLD